MKRIEPGPERGAQTSELGVGRLPIEGGGIGGQLQQDLLEKTGAMKLRRLGVSKTAGVGPGPVEQGGGRSGGRADLIAVDHQVELAYAPGGLQPVHRHREVLRHRQASIHQGHVGQTWAEGGAQQPLLLERLEVLAIDPEQVDGATAGLARPLVGQQLADALGYVIHLHLHQIDLVLALELLPGPQQVGVDLRAAAPGVEIDGLALGLLQGLLPLFLASLQAGRHQQGQCRDEQRGEQRAKPDLEHGDCLMQMESGAAAPAVITGQQGGQPGWLVGLLPGL
ncbi:hypothetical protein D3C84_556400 [compost metagenome]